MTVPRGITLVRLSLLAAVLFGELLAGPASAAEIVSVTGGGVRTDDGHGYKLHMKSVALALRGEIKEGDYDILFNSLKLRHDMGLPVAIIYLNSPGGDFREAMKIGRLIRKLKLTTAVGVGGAEPQICASACMFLMFSGSLRYVQGNSQNRPVLAIHRPYQDASSSQLSVDESKALAALEKEGRAFLAEMSAPQTYIDRIFTTNSAGMDQLSLGEMHRLSWTAPYLDELLIARCGTLNPSDQRKLDRAKHGTAAAYKEFSEKSDVWSKHVKILECRAKELYGERRTALDAMF